MRTYRSIKIKKVHAGSGGHLFQLEDRKGVTGTDYVLSGYFKTKKEASKAKYKFFNPKHNPYL